MGRSRQLVRLPHPVRFVDEEELAEMIAHGGGDEMLARAAQPPFGFRRRCKFVMDATASNPCRTPFVPVRDRSCHVLEIGKRYAVGHHPVRPVRCGGGDAGIPFVMTGTRHPSPPAHQLAPVRHRGNARESRPEVLAQGQARRAASVSDGGADQPCRNDACEERQGARHGCGNRAEPNENRSDHPAPARAPSSRRCDRARGRLDRDHRSGRRSGKREARQLHATRRPSRPSNAAVRPDGGIFRSAAIHDSMS